MFYYIYDEYGKLFDVIENYNVQDYYNIIEYKKMFGINLKIKWSIKDIRLLKNHQNDSLDDLGNILPQYTKHNIKNKLQHLSSTGQINRKYGYIKWTKSETELLKIKYNEYGSNLKSICTFFNRTKFSVQHKLRRMKLINII